METLEDELDVRYHRGLKPDVYYRCPCTESLNGALQNELQKNAASLIPVEIVTEFVFALGSTITIPADQQLNLIPLGIVPAEYPQSITVDLALCRGIEGKDRLKAQRAVARSFIDVFQSVDGFKYNERQALNKEGTDGARFKYVCIDSLQNRDRRANSKKQEPADPKRDPRVLPTYDCGGAIHIKFSTKRDAINVVYKHNPIHRDVQSRPVPEQNGNSEPAVLQDASNIGTQREDEQSKKRGRKKKDQVQATDDGDGTTLDMATSPETQKAPAKKRSRKNGTTISPEEPTTKKKRGRPPKSATQSQTHQNGSATAAVTPTPVAKPYKGPCVRCRENKLKCNQAQPTCYECHRGLWECSYVAPQKKSRSKTGCVNCKQRKRKCSEEKPFCAYCLKVGDDCEYPEPE